MPITKKKILYICSEAASGLIPYAANIIRAASASPHLEVFAITVDDEKRSYQNLFDKPLADRISFLKITPHRRSKYFHKLYPVNILREAQRIHQKHHIDIVHLLTIDYTCSYIIPKLRQIAPVYYTIHDLRPHEKTLINMGERLYYAYMKWGIRRNIKQCTNLATNSRIQFQAMKEQYPSKKIYFHTFPSLVTNSILNGNAVCPEIENTERYILYFGSIEKYKGIEYLHEAFINSPKLSGYKLVIAGNGHLYFPHEPHPRVIFIHRYIQDEEVKNLFKRATCVVYPYISATQSGVLTLSYKLRTPVLVSDIPFFRECADDHSSLFFKRADSADLAEKLETLMFHTDLEQMKAAQEKYYEQHYSSPAITASIEAIYCKNDPT